MTAPDIADTHRILKKPLKQNLYKALQGRESIDVLQRPDDFKENYFISGLTGLKAV